jgi:hypothetical protein
MFVVSTKPSRYQLQKMTYLWYRLLPADNHKSIFENKKNVVAPLMKAIRFWGSLTSRVWMRYHTAVLVAASPPLSEGNHSGCSMMLQSRRAAVEQEEGGRLGAVAIKQEGVRVGKLPPLLLPSPSLLHPRHRRRRVEAEVTHRVEPKVALAFSCWSVTCSFRVWQW